MAHPAAYLPDDFLVGTGEVEFLGKTLVTADGTFTERGIFVYWALVSTVAFTLLYKLSRYYTPLYFKGYKQLSPHDQRDWDTRTGNILYSAYIVYWAARLVLGSREVWESGPIPLVLRTSPDCAAALGVSAGFFIHEMAITVKYWMGGTAMVVHHAGSLLCVLTAGWGCEGHVLTLWMLSTECTTPFIALRYLLDKAGLKAHPLYMVNGLAIVGSWTVARLATFPPFFLTVWRERGSLGLLQPLSRALLMVFPATLFALNAYWYTKIVAGAIKVLGPKRGPGAAGDKHPGKAD